MSTPSACAQIRVVVIDDQALVRAALCNLLESQAGLTIVKQTNRCADALSEVAEKPDVLVVNLPLADGTDELPQLLEANEGLRLLVLTSEHGPEVHRTAVDLGATGLVQKDQPPEVLVKAIKKVHAGEAWFDRSAIAEVLMDISRANGRKRADAVEPGIAELTKREREVVTLVAQGLKNRQVADQLFISDVTVRHHLTSIFSKLGVSDRLELMIYAFRHGLAKPPT